MRKYQNIFFSSAPTKESTPGPVETPSGGKSDNEIEEGEIVETPIVNGDATLNNNTKDGSQIKLKYTYKEGEWYNHS